ncbi:hypothetical protein TNCV_3860641 [Trichonephila clavipes]|nr:hypothetical protein TNCV_3860641 [Trichonephila clavipes]
MPVVSRRVSPCQIHINSVQGMNFRRAEDRGTDLREIKTSTSQLISSLIPRLTHMRGYPMETHLFPLIKPSQFGNSIHTNTVHNFWSILQTLVGAPAVCQGSDTVLIRN